MTAPRRPHRSTRGLPHRSAAGFSLPGIRPVVTLISLPAAISLPTLKNLHPRTAATPIGHNLRPFFAAGDASAHELGT